MDLSAALFYFLAAVIVVLALATVLARNPIYAALNLAGTMVTLALMFFQLGAFFIGGVQLIVYAGAVMVLFVMVLMLFDLKTEMDAFSKGTLSNFLKVIGSLWILGLIAGAVYMSMEMILSRPGYGERTATMSSAAELAKVLFSEYLLAFEALGLLLLMVAIGVVAVSRMKGGTHAEH